MEVVKIVYFLVNLGVIVFCLVMIRNNLIELKRFRLGLRYFRNYKIGKKLGYTISPKYYIDLLSDAIKAERVDGNPHLYSEWFSRPENRTEVFYGHPYTCQRLQVNTPNAIISSREDGTSIIWDEELLWKKA